MGRRDDFLDDERAEDAIRRVLARLDEPSAVPSPPDLVTRTARRLPGVAPAIAARDAARAARVRLALAVVIALALGLFAALGIWSALGSGEQLALLFGDGAGGLSRAVLTLQLLSKPLLRAVTGAGAAALVGGLVALAAAAWLWWWLLQRTPVQYVERAP
jgi:hypothetical protein